MNGHTKGRVEVDGSNDCTGLVVHLADDHDVIICTEIGLFSDAGLADAALIAEAFNVAHETGRTPQQLADERAELVSAADAFIYKRTHETLMNLCAILAKVKGPVQS